MKTFELNLDGMVGPTHNYAGLSLGNVASEVNKGNISNPRAAALQGLSKMKFLHDLGIPQAVLPPHPRPAFSLLRKAGFTGDNAHMVAQAAKAAPELLYTVYSASFMWAANAATISPSVDTADKKIHFTPANLVSKLHRWLEAPHTSQTLRHIFANPDYFVHHDALPAHPTFGDEGAANHMRLAPSHAQAGVEIIVYGRSALKAGSPQPQRFPARHTLEAAHVVATHHQLSFNKVVMLQQHPDAIDAGVFHNDVIAMSNENVFIYHERAYLNQEQTIAAVKKAFGEGLICIEVKEKDVQLEQAVKSYLFNSQLITLPGGGMAIVAPKECEENPQVHTYLSRLIQANDNPVQEVYYLDVRESMRNGGGPACLRLRVAMNEVERKAMKQSVLMDDTLFAKLRDCVQTHYRDKLLPADLADPQLIIESQKAAEAISQIVQLPVTGLE